MAHGYEAVDDRKVRRLDSRAITLHEDDLLRARQRRMLQSNLEDQRRNVTLVAHMIRLHLAYAVDMRFQATTADDGFNRELEAWVEEQSHAENFEVRGLTNARQSFRLLESGALVGGDCFLYKVAVGPGLVQGLEADRIANPADGLPDRHDIEAMTHGVIRHASGAPRLLCICRRDGSRLLFDRMAKAGDVIAHGFYDRWDQGRGVSPLAAALCDVMDYHEAKTYAALKSKLSHILGFQVLHETADDETGFGPRKVADVAADGDAAAAGDDADAVEYSLKLGRGGPEILNMQRGDKLETIESRQPSFEYQAFTDLEVRAILLALDIPWTFYDARKGSYTIQRADKNRYMRLVVPHRERNAQTRNRWVVWKLDRALYETKELALPQGWTIKNVTWEWQPGGEAWLDALKEVMASTAAIRMGFTSPQRICKERGVNWYRVREECREAFHWMVDNGLPVGEWSGEFDKAMAAQLLAGDGDAGAGGGNREGEE